LIYKVYILRSKRDNKRYVGFTNNLEKRIAEHNSGKVIATKNRRPPELIYFEGYENKFEAAKREKFFKSGKGREFLKNINK
jgi:putative endonuclease